MSSIGRLIQESGHSQAEIGRRANVSRKTICAIVHGRRKPSVDVLRRVLDACNASDADRIAILQGDTSTDETRTDGAPVRQVAA